jgi:hypothetical protein
MADVAGRAVAVAATLDAIATAAFLAGCTTDRTTDVSICTARPRPADIGVAGITAMPVRAVARATLSVQDTGVTARGAGCCAGAHGADIRATVGARRASAPVRATAGAVSTCLAGGAAGSAGPTAAVIATRLAARAVRRAARSADTHLARRTADTGADRGIAVLTLAGIAGSSQTDRATRLTSRAA